MFPFKLFLLESKNSVALRFYRTKFYVMNVVAHIKTLSTLNVTDFI